MVRVFFLRSCEDACGRGLSIGIRGKYDMENEVKVDYSNITILINFIITTGIIGTSTLLLQYSQCTCSFFTLRFTGHTYLLSKLVICNICAFLGLISTVYKFLRLVTSTL